MNKHKHSQFTRNARARRRPPQSHRALTSMCFADRSRRCLSTISHRCSQTSNEHTNECVVHQRRRQTAGGAPSHTGHEPEWRCGQSVPPPALTSCTRQRTPSPHAPPHTARGRWLEGRGQEGEPVSKTQRIWVGDGQRAAGRQGHLPAHSCRCWCTRFMDSNRLRRISSMSSSVADSNLWISGKWNKGALEGGRRMQAPVPTAGQQAAHQNPASPLRAPGRRAASGRSCLRRRGRT